MEVLFAVVGVLVVYFFGITIGITSSQRSWKARVGIALLGLALLASPAAIFLAPGPEGNGTAFIIWPVAVLVFLFLVGFSTSALAGNLKNEYARSLMLIGGGALFGLLLGYVFFTAALLNPTISLKVESRAMPMSPSSTPNDRPPEL